MTSVELNARPPAGHELSGYRLVLYWRLSESRRRMVALHGFAILMLPACGMLFSLGAAQLAPEAPRTGAVGWGIQAALAVIAVVLMAVLHEAVHGLVMRLFGAKPQFGVLWNAGAVYATAPGHAFTRNQYLLVALAPLAVLSAAGLPLFAVLPTFLSPALVVFLTLNAAGAAGDIWMSAVCVRFPRTAFIMDERDGMRVFVIDPDRTQRTD